MVETEYKNLEQKERNFLIKTNRNLELRQKETERNKLTRESSYKERVIYKVTDMEREI